MLNATLSAWLRALTSPQIQDITLNLSLNMKCSTGYAYSYEALSACFMLSNVFYYYEI